MKRAVLAFTLLMIISSCSKPGNENTPFIPVSSTADLVAPSSFDWSASLKGSINVTFTNPNRISVENEIVEITDAFGNVLAKRVVLNNSAQFDLELPQNADYYVHFPGTGDLQKITSGGTINMNLSTSGKKAKYKTSSGSCTVCASPFENGGMETPVINSSYTITDENNVPGWETDASDNKIEIWQNGFNGVPAQEGNQFFEINANRPAALFQTLCLTPGTVVKWSVYHRGRAGVDVAQVRIGADLVTAPVITTMTDGTSAWGYYSGSYTIPQGQNTTIFIFEAVSAAGGQSVGNFIDNFEIQCDEDMDGVIDSEDDYPTDPSRAYRSYFPSAGKQILAFEDLWPSLGDFDFNDMVTSVKAEISEDANNNLVDATFKVSIDAIGAGLHNGIALMLYNINGQPFGSNVIASVSGDASLDQGNTNGLILSNDIFADIPAFYQNNGDGPSATPDTLTFTITFNSGITSGFVPELYIFRTADRGLEVHRSGMPITATMDQTKFNTFDDNGDFKTATGLPWAIEIISSGDYQHPKEKIDIINAYPQFQAWATSGGTSNTAWYDFPLLPSVFNN